MREVTLTTIDNPYDPFESFQEWFLFDVSKGYYTCAYLARVANMSDALTDQENMKEKERAIDEILLYDFEKKYKKVEREVADLEIDWDWESEDSVTNPGGGV